MDILIQIITFFVMFLGLWIMLNHFQTIRGWTFYEVLFLYNLNILSHGISGMFFMSPMRQLEAMVQNGEFDGILTRPINPLPLLIFKQFQHAYIGHVLLGIGSLILCINKLNLELSGLNIVMLILVLIGATLIQSAIMIMTGCVSFWFVKATSLSNTIIYDLRRFLNYPLSIYNKFIQFLLTFVIPYGFINFYPSLLFLNKEGEVLFTASFQYGTLIVGLLLYMLSITIWSVAVNKYQSTGS
ncbi:ABC transporter permease [Paenibacillus pinisoli]|nr:ABC-2 family transporter protein [Paenibacillus pinisoli]